MIISRVNSDYHFEICKRIISETAPQSEPVITYSPKDHALGETIRSDYLSALNNSDIHNCRHDTTQTISKLVSDFLASPYYYYFNSTIRRSWPICSAGDLQREKYLINYYLCFWEERIIRKDRILMVFDAPHFPHEYVLLFLAKKYGYKIVILSVMAGDRVFLLDSDFSVIKPSFGDTFFNTFQREISLFQASTHDNFNKQTADIKRRINSDIRANIMSTAKNVIAPRQEYLHGYYGAMIGNSYYTRLQERLLSLRNGFAARRSYNYYSQRCKPFIPEKSTFNIFIPLTCKYENSVDPLWKSMDLYTIIARINDLAKIYGKKVNIYVKEHPLNFIARAHQHYSREIYTYRLLDNIDNVSLISPQTDSFDILQNCDLVLSGGISTITLQCLALHVDVIPIGVSPFAPDIDFYQQLENVISGNTSSLPSEIEELKFINTFFDLNNVSANSKNDISNLVEEVLYALK